jgi:hypothetical protein
MKIFHTTKKVCNSFDRAKVLCRKCGCNNPERLKVLSNKNKGKNNPFYNKKHTNESKIKIANKDMSFTQTKEFKEKCANKGSKNGMYGKSFYNVWLEKYGKERADQKLIELKIKHSKNNKGKNNPMYGKPSPQGSGNGWSGWYKKWYFRSLKELSYMINVIEKNNYKWENGEQKKLTIKYVNYDGTKRTYRPDFLVEDKWLVEVKPKRLMETPNNKLKKEAALIFCEKHNYEYQMIEPKPLTEEEIEKLYENGQIKLLLKYKEKLKCKLTKKKS